MTISFSIKKRIVVIVLVVMTLWPITHHAIARVYDNLSPWKGFAWSMYCVPYRAVGMRVFSVDDRREHSMDHAVPSKRQAATSAMADFARRRTIFGDWVAPDQYGAALLEAFPSVSAIRIEVVEHVVDRKTARMVRERVSQYVYDRSD